MKILVNMNDDSYRALCHGLMTMSDVENVNDSIKHGILLPNNATNGDVLCLMFPNMHYTLSEKSQRVVTTIGIASSFDIDWWNSPYKGVDVL